MKTEKEIAIELVNKYDFTENCGECGGSGQAKQCAILAIDLLLAPNKFGMIGTEEQDFWTEVKKQINKI